MNHRDKFENFTQISLKAADFRLTDLQIEFKCFICLSVNLTKANITNVCLKSLIFSAFQVFPPKHQK